MADRLLTIAEYLATMRSLRLPERDCRRAAKLLEMTEEFPEVSLVAVGERHLAMKVRRKTFAYYLHHHHDDGMVCLCCKSTREKQRALVARDPARYVVPAYLGVNGWVSLRLDQPRIAWEEAFGLLVEGYRAQAPQSLRQF